MFDMNKCKPGDKLLMRDGTTCGDVKKTTRIYYPHTIKYGQYTDATRADDGRLYFGKGWGFKGETTKERYKLLSEYNKRVTKGYLFSAVSSDEL